MAGADGFSDAGFKGQLQRNRARGPATRNDYASDGSTLQDDVATDAIEPRFQHVELSPALSCRTGLTPGQRRVAVIGLAGLGIAGLQIPLVLMAVLGSLLWLAFVALIAWRFNLVCLGVVVGRRLPRLRRQIRPEGRRGPDKPVYSILVAVYREEAVMNQLASALSGLVWPSGRLDIQILFEADDWQTLNAADIRRFPKGTRFTIVPPGGPKTKPNALNHGLARARGDYVCIYDAEDRPHPGQLLEAWRGFEANGNALACLQSPLVADNGGSAWIADQWGLEYATQFGLLLPAMAALDVPIPIGGTSNHFRTWQVRALGGWDAWNVTEDADLGLRMARFGLRTKTLNLPTFEDAPTDLDVWIGQRSRWIKGFMQTWAVLMRDPGDLLHRLGAARFCTLQLSLAGAVIAPLCHVPVLVFVVLAAMTDALSLGLPGAALLATGFLVGLLGDVLAPGPWSWPRLGAVLTRPFYWPLHSICAVRAISELVVAPHFWAKTPHVPHVCAKGKSCSTGSPASVSPPS